MSDLICILINNHNIFKENADFYEMYSTNRLLMLNYNHYPLCIPPIAKLTVSSLLT